MEHVWYKGFFAVCMLITIISSEAVTWPVLCFLFIIIITDLGFSARRTLAILYSSVSIYTVNHKKCGTLFLTITTTFLGRFLHFLQQMKQEEILYNGIIHFPNSPLAVSIHYLVKPSVSMKRQIQHETSNFGVSRGVVSVKFNIF